MTLNPAIESGLRPCLQTGERVSEGQVILVDAADRPIGAAGKLTAHRNNLRHRAISVIIFDRGGCMLLQKRSASKYHSAGLWSNACCSHPRPGESAAAAARRRLREEMGFAVPLGFAGLVSYEAPVGHELWENEIVHVFTGVHDGEIAPDPAEVQDFRWDSVEAVRDDLRSRSEDYTTWFKLYSGASWFESPARSATRRRHRFR